MCIITSSRTKSFICMRSVFFVAQLLIIFFGIWQFGAAVYTRKRGSSGRNYSTVTLVVLLMIEHLSKNTETVSNRVKNSGLCCNFSFYLHVCLKRECFVFFLNNLIRLSHLYPLIYLWSAKAKTFLEYLVVFTTQLADSYGITTTLN